MVAAFANLDHSDVLWVDEHNEGSCPCGRVTETQRDREVLTTEARNDLTSHSKLFGLDYSEKEAIEGRSHYGQPGHMSCSPRHTISRR